MISISEFPVSIGVPGGEVPNIFVKMFTSIPYSTHSFRNIFLVVLLMGVYMAKCVQPYRDGDVRG